MNSKAWWTSKTIWVNAIALGLSIAGATGFQLSETDTAQITTMVLAAVNIVLRMITKGAVTLTSETASGDVNQ